MKLSKINPAKLFKKSRRSVSRTDNSFNSHTSSSSSEDKPNVGSSTPNSVLPSDCLKQAFQMIDRDRDGKINKEDLQSLLTRLGPDPPRPEELKLILTEDGDGCISFDEFYAIGSAFAPPSCDVETRSTFDFFDSDRDGKITAEELFQVFKTIGDADCTLEDCRRMIRNVDMKGDGFVCFEDFRRMMLHQS